MNNLFFDTEIDDYDFFDDDEEDIELYDNELDEYYDETEEDNGGPEYLTEYELDMFDDSAELAEALREAVHEDYQDATPEEMEEALFDILDQMTPAEGFNFTNALRQVGQGGQKILEDPATGQIAKAVLPVAGAAIGTIYGGPAGTAIGGQLGQAAGQAIPAGKKPGIPTATPKTAQAAPQDGSTAAAQLLQLTQNPDMLKSLLALALGSHGKSSIPVGKEGQSVPLGAFMNLFGSLASKAASDADELHWESNEKSDYLLDSEGEFGVDPAVPEDRAQALYETLLAAENQGSRTEAKPRQPWSSYLPFAKGTKLLVEYETVIRDFDIGNGSILERTSDLLKAKIHIDKWDRFDVPETYAMLMIEYEQDGPGNKAVIVVNGKQYTDNNVTIRSGQNTREILMSINFLGQKVDRISISRENSNKAKLKFNAGGDQHVLVLTKA